MYVLYGVGNQSRGRGPLFSLGVHLESSHWHYFSIKCILSEVPGGVSIRIIRISLTSLGYVGEINVWLGIS
jgi:hypothetical protein